MVSSFGLLVVGAILLFNTANGAPRQLIVSEMPDQVFNPVQQILHRVPETITERFTDDLMDQLNIIRQQCEEMEMEIQSDFEHKLHNLSLYQDYMNDIINDQYNNMTDQEKTKVQEHFQMAFEQLFIDEQENEQRVSINCTHEFKIIMDDKMAKALNYAEDLLKQNASQYALLVNDVVIYNSELQTAMKQCLEDYHHTATTASDSPLMKGSPSYVCKQIEIQILTQFVQEFIIKSTRLIAGQNVIDNNVLDTVPEVFPRPEQPTIDLLDSTQDTESPNNPPPKHDENNMDDAIIPNDNMDDDIIPDDNADSDRTHDNRIDNGDDTVPEEDHEEHTHSHHEHTHSHHEHTHSHDNNDRPHPPSNGPVLQHIIISDKPIASPLVNNDHSFDILLISGIVSCVIFVLIIIISTLIIGMKCRKRTTKNWAQLTEKEKILAVKQSGYVNPTYEFFDKVSQ